MPSGVRGGVLSPIYGVEDGRKGGWIRREADRREFVVCGEGGCGILGEMVQWGELR